ncbi:MAG: phosphoribosylaminoimidazolesuccinocarboxamide synthase [Alphaproteobacteria bacterium]|nr:phosphoribosylaminoimidazolesuccinocarboxamide synthase [Alphaproteobacteria bacterium]
MQKKNKKPLREGKAKILYPGPKRGTIIQYFKDDLTAFNNQKREQLLGKGALNNRISACLFEYLHEIGIRTHFLKCLNMREQLIREVEIIPIEVLVRNIAAGTLAKKLGLKRGMPLPRAIVEYCLKNDELGDPIISAEHIFAFSWATPDELDEIAETALRINDFLSGLFTGLGLRLVDLKLEFGHCEEEDGSVSLLLADEISPDTCRLWDRETGEARDKDRFRQEMGEVKAGYEDVARRLGVLNETSISQNF